MIDVKLATFSKRENSTLQFSGAWTTFSCCLKDSTSIINPVIEVRTSSNLSGYNYMYIPDFNRYYFIEDIIYDNGLILISGKCDVLATYKTAIGSSTEYILRSASDFNTLAIDTKYPTIGKTTTELSSTWSPFTDEHGIPNITYIIGMINGVNIPKFGAVTYYVMTPTEMGSFMFDLLSDPTYAQWVDPSSGTSVDLNEVRRSVNPIQYIVEAYALPYRPGIYQNLATDVFDLAAGWYSFSMQKQVLDPNNPIHKNAIGIISPIASTHIQLGKHPQASTRGIYLNSSPFTSYTLNAGCFGDITLDANLLAPYTYIILEINGDCFGSITLDVYGSNDGSTKSVFISRERANVKLTFPIGQVNNNPIQFWTSVLGTAGGIATSASSPTSAIGNLANMYSSIVSGIDALQPKVQKSGSQSSIYEAFIGFRLQSEYNELVAEDNTHLGRPLCDPRQISTLSGYILVADADLTISGTDLENTMIKNYMNGGFYYE